jgi:hypothetical protein
LAIGDLPPAFQLMNKARQAGLRIFSIIEHAKRTPIDGGTAVTSIQGRIMFRSVDFR